MNICLFNPGHNGDILSCLEFVKIFINSNPFLKFRLSVTCSTHLLLDFLNENVTLELHPNIWNIDNRNIQITNNNDDEGNFILSLYDTLWKVKNNTIYINMWQLFTKDKKNYFILSDRIEFVLKTLNEINQKMGTSIVFNCNNYKELIPILPNYDINSIKDTLLSFNMKLVFYYNILYNNYNYDDNMIQFLLDSFSDSIVIVPKKSNINNPRLLSLETNFNILPKLDGSNLIIGAAIANLCTDVYIKNSGGSLFVLNQKNIENKKIKYIYLSTNDEFDCTDTYIRSSKTNIEIFKTEYGINCEILLVT